MSLDSLKTRGGSPGSPMTDAPAPAPPHAVDVDLSALADALKALAYDKRLEALQFLTRPHYIEEIAEHLGIARQAAQKHVDLLVETGVLKKQIGHRASGPVTEFVIVAPRLFALSERFSRLGQLKAEDGLGLVRTQVATRAAAPGRGERGPSLVLVHGMHPGSAFPLGPGAGPFTIGRDEDRHVRLDYDPFVSNRHAEVAHRGGRHVLVDTFSTNGTFLNWARLERGGEVALEPGDVVGVGKSLLVFQK